MVVKLRYVELEPNRIFNWLNPMNVTCWCAYHGWQDTWWEPETVKRREEFGRIWTEEFDKITGHFSKLEESILTDGVRHPINTVSGRLRDAYLNNPGDSLVAFPPEYHSNINETIYTHTFGGSRLTIAQRHDIVIPCVVHDFENLFEDCEEVTRDNYKKWFSDNYSFAPSTPYLRLQRHSHIEEAKYSGMNNNTRLAQREATRLAKEIIDA